MATMQQQLTRLLEVSGLSWGFATAKAMPADLFATVASLGNPDTGAPHLERYDKLASKYGSIVWVYAGVWRIASDLAALPVQVKEVTAEGPKEVTDEKDPLVHLLTHINDGLDYPYSFWEAMFAYLELVGNAYLALVVDERTKKIPVEMYYLEPHYVTVIPGATRPVDGYLYQPSYTVKRYPMLAEDVIHFRYFNPLSRIYGQGSLTAAGKPIASEENASEYAVKLFQNRGRMDGILTTEQTLDETSAQMALNFWRRGMRMLSQNFGTVILGRGFKWQSVTISPKDAEYINQRKMTREDILGALGVPPALVGLESGDVGRRKEQLQVYWRSTLLPKVRHRDGVLNEFLVPKFSNGSARKLIIETDLSGVEYLREDMSILADLSVKLVSSGQMTINESRKRFWALPDVSWGDVWWAPLSLVPAGEAPTEPEPTPGKGIVARRLHMIGPRRLALTDHTESLRMAMWLEAMEKVAKPERLYRVAIRQATVELVRLVVEELGKLDQEKPLTHEDIMRVIPAERTIARIFAQVAKDPLRATLLAGITHALALIERRRPARASRNGRALPARVERAVDPGSLLELPNILAYLRDRPMVYGLEVSETYAKEFRDIMTGYVDQGASVSTMARAMVDYVEPELLRHEAERIVRTEVMSASNLSMMETYKEAKVEKKSWLCVAGGTRVSGLGVSHAARRWYAGPMVELTTMSGRILTVTADHRVLTRSSWVAAKDVHEGDDLICDRLGVKRAAPRAGMVPNVDDVPPTIAEVFNALHEPAAATGAMCRVVHLDSEGRHSEINVVPVNRSLAADLEPVYPEGLRQFALELTDLRLSDLFAQGIVSASFSGHAPACIERTRGGKLTGKLLLTKLACSHKPRVGPRTDELTDLTQDANNGPRGTAQFSSDGHRGRTTAVLVSNGRSDRIEVPPAQGARYSPSGGSRGLPLFRALASNPQPLRFGGTANALAEPAQAENNGTVGTVVLDCQPLGGRALPILFGYDRCVRVKLVPSECHVYDYSTATGWMIANGLIVHNSARDNDVRLTHQEAELKYPPDGGGIPIDEPFEVGKASLMQPGDPSSDAPEEIIQCFTGDTVVRAAGVQRLFRRWFDGEVITIETAAGDKLTGTPNHAILTVRGWVPLRFLREGDHVFRSPLSQKVDLGNPDVEDTPATFEEIASALQTPGSTRRVSGRHMDFHGDGRDSDIDVIDADGLLEDRAQAASMKPRTHQALSIADFGEGAFTGLGNLASPRLRLGLPTHRIVRSLSDPLPFLQGGTGHADEHALATSPRSNARLQQATANDGPADIQGTGECLLGLASKVPLNDLSGRDIDTAPPYGHAPTDRSIDRIQTEPQLIRDGLRARSSSITLRDLALQPGNPLASQLPVNPGSLQEHMSRDATPLYDLLDRDADGIETTRIIHLTRSQFSGHVYNLQSKAGVYIANNILSKNCRCISLPEGLTAVE